MSSHEASTPIHSAIPRTSVILAVLLFVAIEVAMHMLSFGIMIRCLSLPDTYSSWR